MVLSSSAITDIANRLGGKARQRWFRRWLQRDYSWEGLVQKSAIGGIAGENLQQQFIGFHGARSVDEIRREGYLLEVDSLGEFHVAFLPRELAARLSVNQSQLDELKNRFFNLSLSRLVRETSRFRFEGLSLTATMAQHIATRSHSNFEFCDLPATQLVQDQHDRKFQECCFSGDFVVDQVNSSARSLGEMILERCHFSGHLAFRDCDKVGSVRIGNCSVVNSIQFLRANPTNVSILRSRIRQLQFDRCSSSGTVVVSGGRISDLDLIYSEFNSDFRLDGVIIYNSVGVWSCEFNADASFIRLKWPPPGYEATAARGSTFAKLTDFAGRSAPPLTFFDQAYFAKGISFEGISEYHWRIGLERDLSAERSAFTTEFNRQNYNESLQSGIRTIRLFSKDSGNIHLEHQFRRAEIITRERGNQIRPWEKVISRIYGSISDYGASIDRPAKWLVGMLLVMSFCYAWLGGEALTGPRIDFESIRQGGLYSLERSLPIGVFAEPSDTWPSDLLSSGPIWKITLARLLASLHTIISGILIFLWALAIRQKFRLSS